MIQINFTLEEKQIQDLIANSGANDIAKQMLTILLTS